MYKQRRKSCRIYTPGHSSSIDFLGHHHQAQSAQVTVAARAHNASESLQLFPGTRRSAGQRFLDFSSLAYLLQNASIRDERLGWRPRKEICTGSRWPTCIFQDRRAHLSWSITRSGMNNATGVGRMTSGTRFLVFIHVCDDVDFQIAHGI